MLATNSASENTKKLYDAFIKEDEVSMSKLVRQ